MKEELEKSDAGKKNQIAAELESLDSNKPSPATSQPKTSLASALRDTGAYVLIGGPGSGKTTVVKRLARTFALGSQILEDRYPGLEPAFPVVTPLTQYASFGRGASLYDYVMSALSSEHGSTLSSIAKDHWMSGKVILLLDGLDEIVDTAERISCARAIDEIIPKLGKNRLIVSTRRVGYSICRLSAPAKHLALCPFNKIDIMNFIRQWYIALEKANKPDHPNIPESTRLATLLNSEIQGNPSVTLLATNPLMLTIIALIKHQQVTLPERRVELYEVALRTLIHSWNMARSLAPMASKSPSQNIESTREIWAVMAHWMHSIANREVNGEKLYEKLLETLQVDFELPKHEAMAEAQRYLATASETSGLLEARGPSTFAFVHQSFQEYLAALYLARPASKAVSKIYHYRTDPRWHEVIRLAAGHLGVTAGEREVLADLLDSLVDDSAPQEKLTYCSLRVALGCLSDNIQPRQKQIDLIVTRTIACLLKIEYGELKSSLLTALSEAKASPSQSIEADVLNLTVHPDWEVRIEGIKLLIGAKSTSTSAIEHVAKLLKAEPDIDVRQAAAAFLWKAGVRNSEIAEGTIKAQNGYTDVRLPMTAFDEELKHYTISAAKSNNEELAHDAISALSMWPNDSAIIDLLVMLSTDGPSYLTRLIASDTLARVHEQRFQDHIDKVFKSIDSNINKDGLITIAARRLGLPKCESHIKALADDHNVSTRIAISKLVNSDGKSPKYLLAVAERLAIDTEETVRLNASVCLLSKHGRKEATEILRQITESKDDNNQKEAILALAENGFFHEYKENLWQWVENGNESSTPNHIRYAALSCIQEHGNAQENRDRLISMLEKPFVDFRILHLLSELGATEDSTKKVILLLQSENAAIVSHAAHTLSYWGYHKETAAHFLRLFNLSSAPRSIIIRSLIAWAKHVPDIREQIRLLLPKRTPKPLFNLFFDEGTGTPFLDNSTICDLHKFFLKSTSDTEACNLIKQELFDVIWPRLTATM